MPPEDLEVELQCADILQGRLPHWYCGRGDAEPAPDGSPDPEFQSILEAAKLEAAGLRPEPGEDEEGDEDPFLG